MAYRIRNFGVFLNADRYTLTAGKMFAVSPYKDIIQKATLKKRLNEQEKDLSYLDMKGFIEESIWWSSFPKLEIGKVTTACS